ncbi:DUF281 domain-containing protein [Caenorhabditis elegans]|uniref:DUF281 domain-containing protein n=1 Tax=Caenorhabditis elegans TaxID=6239 RepID=Q9XV87_CAEEL|nr:DUF281 domain-containing protein [Caenorhabditis elegans]CAB04138.3 DUF281 domain-containing protein [Caenorhabditis elegans]|eukprot:NP_507421.3 Uncharacterized protein CELE_F20E11.7 [Caenorhabditis elegans]
MNAAAKCTATTGTNSAGCSTLAVKCTINPGFECDITKCMADPAYKCTDAALILDHTGGELTFTGTGPGNVAEASVTCGNDAVWVDSRGIRGNTLITSIAPQSCLPCQTCAPFTDPMSEKATCTATPGMTPGDCATLAVKCMINAGFDCNDVALILQITGGALTFTGTGPGQIAETSVTCGDDKIWQDPNGIRGNTLIASIASETCLEMTGGELFTSGTGPGPIAETSVTCGDDVILQDPNGTRGNTLIASITAQTCLPCQTCTAFMDPMVPEATCTVTVGMTSAGCATLAVKCMINAGFECNNVVLILEITGGALETSGTGPGQIAETSVTCGADKIWQDANGVRGNTLLASVAPQTCP